MQTSKKLSREEMTRRHEAADYDAFASRAIETAHGGLTSGAPVSIRLSRPLLEALDRMGVTQHRKRSNLIQHILWEYVHVHDTPK